MRKQITGYERRDGWSGETIGERSLDLPETSLETKALYFTVPGDVERAMLGAGAGGEAVADGGGNGGQSPSGSEGTASAQGGPAPVADLPEDPETSRAASTRPSTR